MSLTHGLHLRSLCSRRTTHNCDDDDDDDEVRTPACIKDPACIQGCTVRYVSVRPQ